MHGVSMQEPVLRRTTIAEVCSNENETVFDSFSTVLNAGSIGLDQAAIADPPRMIGPSPRKVFT